jgi:signal transduction histidine kinase
MYRGESASAGQQRSVGLGLYIVDQLVRAHGGTVDVTSEPQTGTTFRVSLPRRASEARPLESTESRS